MSQVVQVELSGPLAERVARLVQDGVYEDEAAALRAAAAARFLELYPSPDQMSLGEFIRAHRRGEIGPSWAAERRLQALTEEIQRQGIVFEDADVAMRRIRRRWEFNGEEEPNEQQTSA